MVTKTFVAKVSRIVNNKEKNYVVYRMNVPSNAVEGLELTDNDYLLVKAQKAQWYHLLAWTGGRMRKTWARLPEDIRREIRHSGLLEGEAPSAFYRATSNQFSAITAGYISAYLTALTTASHEPAFERRQPSLSVSVASRR